MTEPGQQSPLRVKVAILGAGLSGICMGIQLRRTQISDFVILEKASFAGGTWRENVYPGIACDVPSHVYSLSFRLNPDWSHNYPSGRELWDYCEKCVDEYGLRPYIRWQTEATSVVFDGGQWVIQTNNGTSVHAATVVSGMGGLHIPKHPDIPGLEDFQGAKFHTAQWDNNCNLAGKRVAIIGTGASSAQVLPAIVDVVSEATVFQRSAAWVLPRLAREIDEDRRKLFRARPWLMRLYRWYLWLLMDALGVVSLRRDSFMNGYIKRLAEKHLEKSVKAADLRQKLTPGYTIGCKRRVVSDDYLSTFNKPNVHLVTSPINRVESGGIRDDQGHLHEADVIIEATGFKPFDIATHVSVVGVDGKQLKDVWADKITSFRTMMVPGFPNFFMLLGPNSATGHTSALIMIESQARYVIKCLSFMEKEDVRQLDPDPDFTRAYNERLQKDIKKMVFHGGCNAWYTDDNDHNYTLWPYSATRFIWELRKFNESEFRLA